MYNKIIYEEETNQYYFEDSEKGTTLPCKLWLETSKKNEAHPDGKMWIMLPKGNSSNRQYYSLDLFKEEQVDNQVVVATKTTAPRVLGTGVKSAVVKYLNEEDANTYTEIVTAALEKYRATKVKKNKKLEDMTTEELELFVEALKNGETYNVKEGPSSMLECMSEEDFAEYNRLLELAEFNKINRPKATRRPLTEEEKAARKKKRLTAQLEKAEALLAMLKDVK